MLHEKVLEYKETKSKKFPYMKKTKKQFVEKRLTISLLGKCQYFGELDITYTKRTLLPRKSGAKCISPTANLYKIRKFVYSLIFPLILYRLGFI